MALKCQPTASHFIDGEYIEDTDGKIIECIYPATGEKIAELHSATPKIVEMALESAKHGPKILEPNYQVLKEGVYYVKLLISFVSVIVNYQFLKHMIQESLYKKHYMLMQLQELMHWNTLEV